MATPKKKPKKKPTPAPKPRPKKPTKKKPTTPAPKPRPRKKPRPAPPAPPAPPVPPAPPAPTPPAPKLRSKLLKRVGTVAVVLGLGAAVWGGLSRGHKDGEARGAAITQLSEKPRSYKTPLDALEDTIVLQKTLYMFDTKSPEVTGISIASRAQELAELKEKGFDQSSSEKERKEYEIKERALRLAQSLFNQMSPKQFSEERLEDFERIKGNLLQNIQWARAGHGLLEGITAGPLDSQKDLKGFALDRNFEGAALANRHLGTAEWLFLFGGQGKRGTTYLGLLDFPVERRAERFAEMRREAYGSNWYYPERIISMTRRNEGR